MMSANMDKLIEYIVERRNELKLTQRQVADVAGINPGTLANIEVGRVTKAPTMDTLEKLAKGLRVDPNVLIDIVRGEAKEAIRQRLRNAVQGERVQAEGLDEVKAYRSLQAESAAPRGPQPPATPLTGIKTKLHENDIQDLTLTHENNRLQYQPDDLGFVHGGDVIIPPREEQRRRLDQYGRLFSNQVQMPFYGKVGCGKVLELHDFPDGSVWTPRELAAISDGIVEASGDSMNKVLRPGMSVAVKRQDWAENGNVVLANIPYQGTICKRYVVREDGAYLKSESTNEYPDVKVEDGVSIVGVAVGAWDYVNLL